MRAFQRRVFTVIFTLAAFLLVGGPDATAQNEGASADAPRPVDVEGAIASSPDAPRVDADIARDAETALGLSGLIDSERIEVSVEEGVVILTGTVDNVLQKLVAMTVAWVNGAAEVNGDGLTIAQ